MQKRHFPESESELSPSDAPPRTSSRLMYLVAAAGTAALTLFSAGCPEPADLQTPEIYVAGAMATSGGTAAGGTAAGGTAAGGTAAGGTASGAACETACMATVLKNCTICHGAVLKSSMLDLEAAGYTARLKDQPAVHGDIAVAHTCPSGDKLIDSANPAESWLLKKVSSMDGECGDPMPQGTGLMGDNLKCVQDYVSCVATGGM